MILITGSGGLIGSEASRFYLSGGREVVGIDNNSREKFFGPTGSVLPSLDHLHSYNNYTHYDIDITDRVALEKVFLTYGDDIELIIHTAAQPSHDWSAKDPHLDFSVNAIGTMHLLELFRQNCPNATFIFTSTNKVYGDNPNTLIEYDELDTRYTPVGLFQAIDETLSIDNCIHSPFGASKLAGDVMCQEYGKYFGLNVGVFRGGCLTGPNHKGVELHGFLSYLVKCAKNGVPYTVHGYKGKQVRDNIHSKDLISCFEEFRKAPKQGEVYNVGGGVRSNCSILEAVAQIESLLDKKMEVSISDTSRVGDHIWYISDMSKFRSHFPEWKQSYDLSLTLEEMCL